MVHVSVPREIPVPLQVEFSYCATDPYAVRLSIGPGHASPVHWTLSRELLSDGIDAPSGIGDVLVRPRAIGRRRFVNITLRSTAGSAALLCPVREVAAFLRHTFTHVPEGSEEQYLDLDKLVLDLTQR
ncbi:SsgA family sporulation/cell division regulator [Streptomyces sp. NPDC048521]|uniref:SsgA family sporulation/cell division regulator n=1 Tax=Streptomyces sp. NPDC048521 TaxID=3365566 RepID=UPI003721CF77